MCVYVCQLRAAELNPNDPYNHFGIGQWYDVVAGLGYTKRKLAAWVFGSEVKVRHCAGGGGGDPRRPSSLCVQ